MLLLGFNRLSLFIFLFIFFVYSVVAILLNQIGALLRIFSFKEPNYFIWLLTINERELILAVGN